MSGKNYLKLQKDYKQELKNWHDEKDMEQKKYYEKKNVNVFYNSC